MRVVNGHFLLFAFGAMVASGGSLTTAHEWTDKSGRYRVEAELVSANKELVVLRTEDHRLIALDVVQLSDSDQAYIRAKMAETAKAGETKIPTNVLPPSIKKKLTDANATDIAVENAKDLFGLDTSLEDSSVAERSAATAGGWRLVDGQRIQGEFVGFDLKPLMIKRALGKVYVGGVLFSQLDPVYRHILPMTIAHLENAKIDDVRDIDHWLKNSGPGPWTYNIEAVMIETPNRGSVAIPTFLLSKYAADSIAVPLRR